MGCHRAHVHAGSQPAHLSNFVNIIGELKDRLHRWTRAGQYGFLFDNAHDTLTFSRFQTFNFAGWGDAPEVLEPLVVLRAPPGQQRNLPIRRSSRHSKSSCSTKHGSSSATRPSATTSSRRRRPGASTTPQWFSQRSQLRNCRSRACCTSSPKAARPRSSSPTRRWIAMLYREAFHLNDTELDLIAGPGSAGPDAHPQGAVIEEGPSERRFGDALDGDQQRHATT